MRDLLPQIARLAGITLLALLLLDMLRLLPDVAAVGWLAFPPALFLVIFPILRR